MATPAETPEGKLVKLHERREFFENRITEETAKRSSLGEESTLITNYKKAIAILEGQIFDAEMAATDIPLRTGDGAGAAPVAVASSTAGGDPNVAAVHQQAVASQPPRPTLQPPTGTQQPAMIPPPSATPPAVAPGNNFEAGLTVQQPAVQGIPIESLLPSAPHQQQQQMPHQQPPVAGQIPPHLLPQHMDPLALAAAAASPNAGGGVQTLVPGMGIMTTGGSSAAASPAASRFNPASAAAAGGGRSHTPSTIPSPSDTRRQRFGATGGVAPVPNVPAPAENRQQRRKRSRSPTDQLGRSESKRSGGTDDRDYSRGSMVESRRTDNNDSRDNDRGSDVKLHPCNRVFRSGCNAGPGCPWIRFPYAACVKDLKGHCKFGATSGAKCDGMHLRKELQAEFRSGNVRPVTWENVRRFEAALRGVKLPPLGVALKGDSSSTPAAPLRECSENVHPCIRVYGKCGSHSCRWKNFPREACVRDLKGICHNRQSDCGGVHLTEKEFARFDTISTARRNTATSSAFSEKTHPCLRVHKDCFAGNSCCWKNFPFDACLRDLKGECRHPDCDGVHLTEQEFRRFDSKTSVTGGRSGGDQYSDDDSYSDYSLSDDDNDGGFMTTKYTLNIKNLPDECDAQMLRKTFEQVENVRVRETRMIGDREGAVEFETVGDAQLGLKEFQGEKMYNRPMRIRFAKNSDFRRRQ